MTGRKTFRAVRPTPCFDCGGTIPKGERIKYRKLKSGAEVAIHNPRCPK